MKRIYGSLLVIIFFAGCHTYKHDNKMKDNEPLAGLLQKYYNERMQLFPLEATANGDSLYNNLLPADFTDNYRERLKNFFNRYSDEVSKLDSTGLNDNDLKSYEIFRYEIRVALEGLDLGFMASTAIGVNRLMPFDQFNGIPLSLGRLGSGMGNQPFHSVKDYDNWLQRGTAFSSWSDSAIIYFKKGMAQKYVLPESIVIKMLPQLRAMITDTVTSSLFYEPIKNLPKAFSDADKKRLDSDYINMISRHIIPAYKKLSDFLEKEYLPVARLTAGVNDLPGGDKLYSYLVRYWTTTNKTSQEIYNTGIAEVRRIRNEMEKIKEEVRFTGTLDSFFKFMKNDKRFMPYKTPDEVLAAFRNIQVRIDPNLKKMFSDVPKTKFEIRQTESFREASASAEYNPGLPDGSRPGIFYVPIPDAAAFNTTSGMESLFLHEAIPGHHFQISIQSENSKLPQFRRFIWYGAYGEGYALYCESLGKELGLYTDPYQHMGALGDEILRAIRLVVDVGMHTGKMTREEAIRYMTDNESISDEAATAEIERYMVFPGQALSYKTGALKIWELRHKYEKELGAKFKLADFHKEFLKDGCMPLEVIEKSMDQWAKRTLDN